MPVHFLCNPNPIRFSNPSTYARERHGRCGTRLQHHEPVEFLLRPFVGLRDFRTLQRSDVRLTCDDSSPGLLVRGDTSIEASRSSTAPHRGRARLAMVV
jgi:hypothetical protein